MSLRSLNVFVPVTESQITGSAAGLVPELWVSLLLVNRFDISGRQNWTDAKSMVISGNSTMNDEDKKPTVFIPKINISSQLL